ncbi:MAG TPA: tetratricopeptide repeat protein [Bacteroidia bacterium]|jgi:tetratricopeptide (TPR) repeat protein|nr:tetratricopeptide repeat protein [Bacteroidia bacterium]
MKSIITISFAFFTAFVFSQNNQVLNSYNYLKSKEYDKAKAAADAAAENESTKNNPKMWMYRGEVYRAIYEDKDEKVRNLDMEAEEKALEAYMNCLKIDLKENAKSPIYKDDVKGPIVVASAAVNRKAKWYGGNKQFDKAVKCYDMVENALIYDFDQGMKRNNLTKEKLLYNKFEMYAGANDIPKMIEFADKLIAINYKDPKIFIHMTNIMLGQKDTVKALTYIDQGKKLFDDNMDLINLEINIYLAQGKSAQLKEKLQSAISLNDNEVLHAILANIYTKTNEPDKAEAEYLKALEIKPEYEVANYNLGVVYFNKGNEWSKKAGDLPPKEAAKAKDFDAKALVDWKKSVVYFEKSYEVNPDKATKQRLRQLLMKLGETEKAEKYK